MAHKKFYACYPFTQKILALSKRFEFIITSYAVISIKIMLCNINYAVISSDRESDITINNKINFVYFYYQGS